MSRFNRECCGIFYEEYLSGRIFFLLILLLVSASSFGEELSIQHTPIARSGISAIPAGNGAFTGFGDVPAIDEDGNVAFTGAGGLDNNGSYQSGVYSFIGGNYQKVADKNTLVPGGGGTSFTLFSGAERNDIDDGRVAFTARISTTSLLHGLYSNVGQTNPNNLIEILRVDGGEWASKGDPYIDRDIVSVRGQRLIPDNHTTIMLWDGLDYSTEFIDPGPGYIVTQNTQASISGDAVMFRRYKTGFSEMGISVGGNYETLVVLNSTPVPGLDGSVFKYLRDFPIVDRDGLDAAFIGSDGTIQGVFKRTDGGALESVANTVTVVPGTTPIPGWGDQMFNLFPEDGLSLANGHVTFLGDGPNSLEGIYTDIGGSLSVIVDNDENSTIVIDGQTRQITDLGFGPKSFAYTPDGYMIVFKAWFTSGETAIIRATITIIDNGQPGVSTASPPGTVNDSFTVNKDFSDDSSNSVSINLSCSSGTVTNNPQLAREGAPAVFNITGAATGATCTAAESVPSGYTANQADCQNGDPLNSSCTIINTLNQPSSDSFTVYKDFSDNNSASVSISLGCTSGTVTNNPQLAREGAPAVFNITGASVGATCTATESVPSGYTANLTDCQNGDPLNGSCTIANTQVQGSNSFTVFKDFTDNNPVSVSITLSCTKSTVTNNPQFASEASPAIFYIDGAKPNVRCTATENSVPAGYTVNQADCQNGDRINSSCTIVNTQVQSSN